jgi:hypothetical protein
MNHHRFHWLEKLQVQIATVIAVVAIGVFLWPVMQPRDPQLPVAFLAESSTGQAGVFVATIWVLAAAGALLALSSRPEGVLMAALVGAGGISLRSRPMRVLLQGREADFGALFHQLIFELLLLSAALLVAMTIVDILRRTMERLKPEWVWRNPLLAAEAAGGSPARGPVSLAIGAYVRFWRMLFGVALRSSKAGGAAETAERGVIARTFSCLMLELVISVPAVLIFMQSGERGQVLFALGAGFVLAGGFANHFFPTPHSAVAWIVPIVVGVFFYVLASFSSSAGDWAKVPAYAQALPIDWLTAGCGGSLLGYWISARLHEHKHFEEKEAEAA